MLSLVTHVRNPVFTAARHPRVSAVRRTLARRSVVTQIRERTWRDERPRGCGRRCRCTLVQFSGRRPLERQRRRRLRSRTTGPGPKMSQKKTSQKKMSQIKRRCAKGGRSISTAGQSTNHAGKRRWLGRRQLGPRRWLLHALRCVPHETSDNLPCGVAGQGVGAKLCTVSAVAVVAAAEGGGPSGGGGGGPAGGGGGDAVGMPG